MIDTSIRLPFTKMTGAGNDFVLIDNRSAGYQVDWTEVAKTICNRHFGVGSDGLLVLQSGSPSSFCMNYYNADGSYGGMCGNGGRCAAAYMMDQLGTQQISFEALDHTYQAYRTGSRICLKMKQPVNLAPELNLKTEHETIPAYFVDTGSPHAVIFLRDLSPKLIEEIVDEGLGRIGPIIRNYEQFHPEGTNVDFVQITGTQSITMRTFERGVEGETLACGTGAVASAIITSIRTGMDSPITVKTFSNEFLEVRFRKEGRAFIDVELIGSASVVFVGEFTYFAKQPHQ